MSSSGSVTAWIRQLEAGEESVLIQLHGRYWPRLVTLARRELKGVPARASDEEDVAQAAFWSFCHGLKDGQRFQLRNRHELWALLTHIVACKAVNQIQHEIGVQKRGGGRVQGESALDALASGSGQRRGLEQAAGDEPTPLEQVLLRDSYRHFIGGLAENLRDFAELHLAGCTHREIAVRKGCVVRTVERKMALVFHRWQEMAAESLGEELSVSACV